MFMHHELLRLFVPILVIGDIVIIAISNLYKKHCLQLRANFNVASVRTILIRNYEN